MINRRVHTNQIKLVNCVRKHTRYYTVCMKTRNNFAYPHSIAFKQPSFIFMHMNQKKMMCRSFTVSKKKSTMHTNLCLQERKSTAVRPCCSLLTPPSPFISAKLAMARCSANLQLTKSMVKALVLKNCSRNLCKLGIKNTPSIKLMNIVIISKHGSERIKT